MTHALSKANLELINGIRALMEIKRQHAKHE
jgi:hypothetical protein